VTQGWRRGLLALALGLAWPVGAQSPDKVAWVRGDLSARLIQAGYSRDVKSGSWDAQVELRFVNRASSRRFHQGVLVQFLDGQGKVLGAWKTFLSLPAGEAQHRRVMAPGNLACPGSLAGCPGLSVRLVLASGKPLDPPAPIPQAPLQEEDAPPAGEPLYVARVVDGVTLQLMGGQKIGLLGLLNAQSLGLDKAQAGALSRQAADELRLHVMDGPVSLAFDGERRDASGRWMALVQAEDGSLVNLESLKKGLARVDADAVFARKGEFEQAEKEAQAQHQGLWGQFHP
jgi:endonuclease YncB( thermonuclease family)